MTLRHLLNVLSDSTTLPLLSFELAGRALRIRHDRADPIHPQVSASASVSHSNSHVQLNESIFGTSKQGGLQEPVHLVHDRADDSEPLFTRRASLTDPRPCDRFTNGSKDGSSEQHNKKDEKGNKDNALASATRHHDVGGRVARTAQHPGRITMPTANPFGMAHPLSPIRQGGLPPMTPSMPGYNFHAYPATPPLHPLSFLSPGIGQFSPTLNSPRNFGYYAAPGAPLMTPGVPHPISSLDNAWGPPGASHIAHTPGHGHVPRIQAFAPTPGAPVNRQSEAQPDYFPSVPLAPQPSGSTGQPGEGQDPGLSDVENGTRPKQAGGVSAASGGASLGSIREQIESLVLSNDAHDRISGATAAFAAAGLGNSRASLDVGMAGGRDHLGGLLAFEQGGGEKDRRASMDDVKRS